MTAAEELLIFNGVDTETGAYLTPPTSLANLASGIRGERPDGSHLKELQRRRLADEADLGVIYGRDPGDPASAGWGLIVPRDLDPAMLEALGPLVSLRREQAGDLYKQLVVETGDDKDRFLRRNGMGPGPADPRKVPYYLLIVGTPEQIPFSFQYQLDVSYAVGRLDFDTAGEYASYAGAVVAAEAPSNSSAGQGVHLFGVRNPGDTPTALSASRLVEPLAAELRQASPGWAVTDDVGAPATKQRLYDLLMGSRPHRCYSPPATVSGRPAPGSGRPRARCSARTGPAR